MKKLLVFLMCITVALLCFAGCGADKKDNEAVASENSESTVSVVTEETGGQNYTMGEETAPSQDGPDEKENNSSTADDNDNTGSSENTDSGESSQSDPSNNDDVR